MVRVRKLLLMGQKPMLCKLADSMRLVRTLACALFYVCSFVSL